MALLKKLIGGRSRALPVGRGVPFRPISGRGPRPISIGRPVAPPGGLRPLPIQPPNLHHQI